MKKAYDLFFLALLLLPIAIVLFSAIANPSFDMQTAFDFVTGKFVFTPFVNLFYNVFNRLGWSLYYNGALYLFRYASYGFIVLFVKVAFDLVTFLPVLCADFLERRLSKK